MTAVVVVTRDRLEEVAFENGAQVECPPDKPATCHVGDLLYVEARS